MTLVQGMPRATRSRKRQEGPSPRASRGSQNLDFGLLAPRTVGEQGFVILSPQSVEICYGGHRKLTRVASWDLGSDAGAVDIFLYIRPGCFSLHKPVPVPPAWDAKPGFGVPS